MTDLREHTPVDLWQEWLAYVELHEPVRTSQPSCICGTNHACALHALGLNTESDE